MFDSLFVANGTFFLVADTPSSLPSLDAIGSSAADPTRPPRPTDWQILTKAEARDKLGTFGGRYASLFTSSIS